MSDAAPHLQRLVDACAVPAWATDATGRTVAINAMGTDLLGPPAPGGARPAAPAWIHPADANGVQNALDAAHLEARGATLELRLRHPGEADRWTRLLAAPHLSAAGDFAGLLLQVVPWAGPEIDSDRATLIARLQRYVSQLERSSEELDRFAKIASHDLKAPLRAIDQLALWIAEDAGDTLSAASQRHLELIGKRVSRMQRLLEDLLAYARATDDGGDVRPVALGRLIAAAVELAEVDPERVHVPDQLPVIETAVAPLQTVLTNLVGNAARHGGAAVRVTISVVDRGEDLEIRVADDGVGIEPQHHARIFGMFESLQARDERSGSGVGLAIVKKVVESVGGRVGVQSSPGAGSTFWFLWPKRAPAPVPLVGAATMDLLAELGDD